MSALSYDDIAYATVTLTALAKATGISKSTLSRLMAGQQRRPGLELLLPNTRALRISLDDVIHDVAPQEGPSNRLLAPRPWNGVTGLVVLAH
ncbi:helix-turn-helix transcriptional regulator [Streptomyces sp. NPDC004533]|uniref:helix-turn-helix domain-containing protein n=1 Tax=Streptomyces sp. NPDC004533 TaxID=3154278 RepID=UPI0033BC972B